MATNVLRGLGLAAVCALWWCTSAAAQQERMSAAACPVGYWQLELLCLNDTTGDLVLAEAPGSPRLAYEPGCRPGYWRLGDLCQSSATGDIELVDEGHWPVRASGAQPR